MKGLKVTEIAKETGFKGLWGELGPGGGGGFTGSAGHRVFEATLVFMWGSALWEKFNLCFSIVFCYHWQNFQFGSGTGHSAIILRSLDTQ